MKFNCKMSLYLKGSSSSSWMRWILRKILSHYEGVLWDYSAELISGSAITGMHPGCSYAESSTGLWYPLNPVNAGLSWTEVKDRLRASRCCGFNQLQSALAEDLSQVQVHLYEAQNQVRSRVQSLPVVRRNQVWTASRFRPIVDFPWVELPANR